MSWVSGFWTYTCLPLCIAAIVATAWVWSAVETETASRDNGTIFYDSQLQLVLTGLTAALVNQAKLLSRNRMLIFLEDNNGRYHAIGLKNGADKTTGTRELGGALGDFYGLKMSLQALEPETSPILSNSAVTSLLALVSDEYVNE